MHLFYSLCFTAGFLLALPYFLFQAIRHRKYLASLAQRLGSLPKDFEGIPRGGLWIHAVSVGEVLAIAPLVYELQHKWPDRALFVSTTTITGQKLAQSRFGGQANLLYFPLDWNFAVRKALASVRPAVVLIAETEIWPNFLRQCRKQNIPVLLINGRLSDRSVRRYRKVRRFMNAVLNDFSYCCMQTKLDRQRLLSLGGREQQVEVCGNLKYELAVPEGIEEKTQTYRQVLRLGDSRFVVVAGSTMKGEEGQVLSAFAVLRDRCPRAVLILAPRHPERFAEVEAALAAQVFHYCRRSQLKDGSPDSIREVEVVLLDTMGELATIYALADLVFIGGSLVPTGGHNILEPALFSKPVVFGPHMSNFREISEYFLKEGAAIQVSNSQELGEKFVDLFVNADHRQRLGEKGNAILLSHRGAAGRILERVERFLTGQSSKPAALGL
jgi:3-deoxy-D-manno-octulosonic-acid transferase